MATVALPTSDVMVTTHASHCNTPPAPQTSHVATCSYLWQLPGRAHPPAHTHTPLALISWPRVIPAAQRTLPPLQKDLHVLPVATARSRSSSSSFSTLRACSRAEDVLLLLSEWPDEQRKWASK